ncbi:Tol-Pal system beta propeller repeat protein TolB [Candidatus Njordibacter sp. Uisw_056]|uniref:Tol-Pal system beta propeller repeat protein TolB n=1 Tax=Candidatus Njordibacter sp. Uisw_056 TaxID=3230973 RepID=UPI003D3DC717
MVHSTIRIPKSNPFLVFSSAVFTLLLSLSAWSSELVIEITQGVDNPVPIAVVPFQWSGDSALNEDVAQVVDADLERSGQFKSLKRSLMLSFPYQKEDIYFRDWSYLATEYLIIGQVLPTDDGGYQVDYQLFDVQRQESVAGARFTGGKNDLRALAHSVSDAVYEALTGLKGAFRTRIAYVAADKKVNPSYYKLLVADADGYNAKEILKSNQPIMSPSWSRDASKLAYVSFETNRPAIYVQDITTGKRERIKSFKGINGAPAWSPDGSKLAIVLSKDGNAEIYVLDLTTNRLTRVTKHYGIDTEPSWSVDGKNILFTSDRGGKPQIYQVTLDSGWVERLTFEGDYNARGSLTHDGRFLVLVSRHDSQFHIAVQDLQRGTMSLLTQTSLDESPSVAPNGSMVIYSTQDGGRDILAAVSIDGKVKFNIPANEGVVREPAWSPYLN